MNNYTWKERLQYWFDEKMAKGPSALIYLLGVVTVVMVLLLACVYAGIEGEAFSSSLWNSFASTVNAWVAYYEDGSPVYLIVMSLAAIGGLFITSMLIGILTASIEEKMGQLRKGNSKVIESSHWVILGSVEHSILLIDEIIMSLGDEKKTLVFACNGEKDELEDQIKSKIDIPDNIKFVVRSVDTKDSDQLDCLSLNDAQKIIINEEDDFETLKCLLAVNNVLSEGDSEVKIVTYIKHMENDALCKNIGGNRVFVACISDVISRIIGRTCTQTGLVNVFMDVLDFSNVNMYFIEDTTLVGKSFNEAYMSLRNKTLVGVYKRNKKETLLNPDGTTMIEKGDCLLVFGKEEPMIYQQIPAKMNDYQITVKEEDNTKDVLIFNYNEGYTKVLKELALEKAHVVVVKDIDQQIPDCEEEIVEIDFSRKFDIQKLIMNSRHVIILSDPEEDYELSDQRNMMLYLRIKEIKERLGLYLNTTVVLRFEANKHLLEMDEESEFIVPSQIAALVLAQVSDDERKKNVFTELLSSKGNEFYLVHAHDYVPLNKELRQEEVRSILLKNKAIYLGYRTKVANKNKFVLNPDAQDVVEFKGDDKLVVLKEN